MEQKVWLMVAAALVIFANAAIWTVPNSRGKSLFNQANDESTQYSIE